MIYPDYVAVENHMVSGRPKSDVQLTIIIVSWNTRDLLIQCLDSIYGCSPKVELETVVVDNASTDGSAVAVRERFPQVRLIANTQNVGFARANNQAIHQSTGRFVLLLNPDTKVLTGALEALVDFLCEHSDAGAVGARILNQDGSLQYSCYPAPTLSRELWRLLHLDILVPFGIYRMANWNTNTPRKVDAVLGACLLVRREAFAHIGLLDEDYFFTGEEIDLCHRLRRASWQIYWVPQAQVIHYGGQSSKLVAENTFLRLYHGKILYFRKRHNAPTAALYKLVLLITTLARLVVTPLAWLERPPRREQHLVLAARYWQLLRTLSDM